MKLITELEGIWKGQDVYVVAAGASAGLIDPSFFDGKAAIGVNEVYVRFSLPYYIRKEDDPNTAAVDNIHALGGKVVVSQYVAGSVGPQRTENEQGDYYFKHANNDLDRIDFSVMQKSGYLIVSWSTITSAIHLAVVMGAKNVILVGHDCCLLDGRANMAGYPKPIMDQEKYKDWLTKIQEQTQRVRSAVYSTFRVRVYSLNPFLGIDLEGHKITHG